jgi:hypothetical protein
MLIRVASKNSIHLTRSCRRIRNHHRMIAIGILFARMLCDCFKPRYRLEAEILLLRHQLNVLQQRASRRVHLRWVDRALFIWLYRRCPRILDAITIRPETVVRWHRKGFAAHWRWRSRSRGGRPRIGQEVRNLTASPLRFAGSSTPRSSRCEAADRMTSCVSVSLDIGILRCVGAKFRTHHG